MVQKHHHQPPSFFSVAFLLAYSLVIGALCFSAAVGWITAAGQQARAFLGLALFLIFGGAVMVGLYVWLRRCDLKAHAKDESEFN